MPGKAAPRQSDSAKRLQDKYRIHYNMAQEKRKRIFSREWEELTAGRVTAPAAFLRRGRYLLRRRSKSNRRPGRRSAAFPSLRRAFCSRWRRESRRPGLWRKCLRCWFPGRRRFPSKWSGQPASAPPQTQRTAPWCVNRCGAGKRRLRACSPVPWRSSAGRAARRDGGHNRRKLLRRDSCPCAQSGGLRR